MTVLVLDGHSRAALETRLSETRQDLARDRHFGGDLQPVERTERTETRQMLRRAPRASGEDGHGAGTGERDYHEPGKGTLRRNYTELGGLRVFPEGLRPSAEG